MSDELPYFRYHPDPVSTGYVVESDVCCVSCDKSRGFIYTGPVYAVDEYEENICPWCIADGSAAEKFEAEFISDFSEPVSPEITQEIGTRTPGFLAWQQEEWQVHCGDACEFHGNVTKADMKELKPEAKSFLRSELELNEDEWTEFIQEYEPKGDSGIYKFICRLCRKEIYSWDCT